MKTNIFAIMGMLILTIQLNYSQTLNQEITAEGKTPYLLGKIDKNGLEGDNYKSWFTKNHGDYTPNSSITNSISSLNFTVGSLELLIIFGSGFQPYVRSDRMIMNGWI